MRYQSNATKNRLNSHIAVEGHYVYAHTKQNGEVFYIGKGRYTRAWNVSKRRMAWYNITKNEPWKVVILANNLTNSQCMALELEVIAHFAKFNKLVNHVGIVKWTKN